eukprot:TRINITY_DN67189_c3_g1_i1.p1 TRINITY_DN67189_c3_g1~~TRINITY_DN67189_c3_g1_i1.p1  ORF type:complete len:556 (-),score=121.05 TRINITY_DN67189_c3_g1_i1:666-2333(-)
MLKGAALGAAAYAAGSSFAGQDLYSAFDEACTANLGVGALPVGAAALVGTYVTSKVLSGRTPEHYIQTPLDESAYQVLGKKKDLTNEDIPQVNQELKQSFASGRTRPVAFRVQQLKQLHKLIKENEEELIKAIQMDLNRPRVEALLYDVLVTLHEVESLIKNTAEWAQPEKRKFSLLTFPSTDTMQAEPYGTTLVIGTWNYPIMLTLIPLAGAIAAGNCCILKPSNVSAYTAKTVANLVQKYMDPYTVSVIGPAMPGDRGCIQALMKEQWDYLFFTGGPTVGKLVYQAAAAFLTPCSLELGGKNAVFVDESADVSLAAKKTVWGRMMNAGQQCIGPDYVMVHKSVENKFVKECVRWLKTCYTEDPQKAKTVGNIVNARHMERLIAVLKDPAGTIVHGGSYKQEEKYIEPTILQCGFQAKAMEEETFGPILIVVGVDSMDQAIKYCNSREKSLSQYIFAGDQKVIDKILQNTSAGGVTVNGTLMHAGHPDLPFGGVGTAGIGAYHGKATFDTFSHLKPVCQKSVWPDMGLLSDPFFLYPPWTGFKETLLRNLMKMV